MGKGEIIEVFKVNDNLTAKQLEKKIGITKASICRALRVLIDEGILTKEKAKKSDYIKHYNKMMLIYTKTREFKKRYKK